MTRANFVPREQCQPDLRPPPTECLRDSFAREDSSAPCCINFFPPRRSRLPRKGFFSFFLVFFFLAMDAKYLTQVHTSMRIPNSLLRLSAISNAEALADWHDGVLEIREARYQFQVLGDLLGMGENVIGDDQRFLGELGQQDLKLLGDTPATGIEKKQIERPGELAGNLGSVARAQLDAVEQIRAAEILARQGVLVGITVDAEDSSAGGRERPRQPYRAVGVRCADLDCARHSA